MIKLLQNDRNQWILIIVLIAINTVSYAKNWRWVMVSLPIAGVLLIVTLQQSKK
jgi:hypothetical protein